LNRRQVRWSELLSTYNFQISYRKGTENARADALSRRSDYGKDLPNTDKPILKETSGGTLEYNRELMATTVVVEGSQWTERIKEAYIQDSTAKRIQDNPTSGYTLSEGLILFQEKVYVPTSLRTELIREQHSAIAHGHQGIFKTTDRIKRTYYIPGLQALVEKELGECNLCKRAKASRHAPYGLLQPLDAPDAPWKTITMDFIVKLPPSQEPMTGAVFDSILVATDKLSKYAHFIPFKEACDARGLSYIFLKEIVSTHGLPEKLISD